ncbi:MAG: glucose-1-phosphate adenylyltransferase subunit GlgD [Firmicutes bacterium]|nr:glucose-1-phosphate adenylyltransferase subunit GlgD [Bacillota bacterium]
MRAIGIILAGGNSQRLKDLTKLRAIAAMPMAGAFRAIDFTLSNMSNSNINKVAVIAQYNSRSLQDHLSAAKWWDLDRKQGGLFIFTPFLSRENNYWFRGIADSIYQNISFLKRSHEPYVVIASGDAIYKMDYNDIINYHIEKGADVTICYKDLANTDKNPQDFGVIQLDYEERMSSFEEKPLEPKASTVSLGIYVIQRSLLIKLLEAANADGNYDFVKDIILRNKNELNIFGYKYDGYWSTLNSINAYMSTNMDFLKKDVREMLTTAPYIVTKPKDEPPAKYNYGADVKNSIIASGSIINGTVRDSVLFRNVFLGEYSSVKNSIIMGSSYIGKGCVIENAILDKEVVVADGKQIIGEPGNPIVISKGQIV